MKISAVAATVDGYNSKKQSFAKVMGKCVSPKDAERQAGMLENGGNVMKKTGNGIDTFPEGFHCSLAPIGDGVNSFAGPIRSPRGTCFD